MLKKIIIMFLAAVLLLPLTACGKGEGSGGGDDRAAPKVFDMEAVRKSIIIQGSAFEIPVMLRNLPKGWTYVNEDYASTENVGLVSLLYNGTKMFMGTVENYVAGHEDDGFVFSIAINAGDCSVDGIVPQKTTLAEVKEMYGEPDAVQNAGEVTLYLYGKQGEGDNFDIKMKNSRSIAIVFDDKETVAQVSVVYGSFAD